MSEFLAPWLFALRKGALWRPVLTHRRYRRWFPRARPLEALVEDAAGVADAAALVFLRKRRVNDLSPALLGALGRVFVCARETRKYLILGRPGETAAIASDFFDRALAAYADAGPATGPALFAAPAAGAPAAGPRAVIVTTYNRPEALARALPGIAGLGAPVLVVDDGSDPAAARRNAGTAAAHGARLIALPANRGVAAALSIGLDYWLADPGVEWISYFQDDVEVAPDLFEILARYEDAAHQPLLTGFDTNTYEAERTEERDGRVLKFKRDTTGMHLHGHRDYWLGVMPIPSRYLGAPKQGRGTAGEDTWIVNRAPGSVARRGLEILCVPGLVTSFARRAEDSTWGNQHLADGPLR